MRIGLRELEATFKHEAPRPKKVAKLGGLVLLLVCMATVVCMIMVGQLL